MLNEFSLLVFFLMAVGIAGAIVALSAAIGRREVDDDALIPYECGLDPIDAPRRRFSIKFFIIATLFIVFDVEIVFLFPWAVVYRDMIASGHGALLFAEMAIFIGALAIGLIYVWKVGALQWEE
jgi:NADH-quinone oxidoreductase subunit A